MNGSSIIVSFLLTVHEWDSLHCMNGSSSVFFLLAAGADPGLLSGGWPLLWGTPPKSACSEIESDPNSSLFLQAAQIYGKQSASGWLATLSTPPGSAPEQFTSGTPYIA